MPHLPIINFKVWTGSIPSSGMLEAYLYVDSWDDWFTYQTQYQLTVFDGRGVQHEIGRVKIGFMGLTTGRPPLLPMFQSLNEQFFSLGQDEKYYTNLHSLHRDLRIAVVIAIQDMVYNANIYHRAVNENVTKVSLFRTVSPSSVRGQFVRLLNGQSRLTKYHFQYSIPQSARIAGYTMDFEVVPNSSPPTNVHILVGRNGVGKTHLLNNMVQAIVDDEASITNVGSFANLIGDTVERELFAGVISVSFSAFDPFEPLTEKESLKIGVRYSYVGLKRDTNRGGKKGTPKSHEMLVNDFSQSLRTCVTLNRLEQWMDAIEMLSSDPLFEEIGLQERLLGYQGEDLENEARKIFRRMSSGHSVVLLTITKLIEKVEEKTLVLIDEPECHLHPPLLSAFTRTLSEIISHRNGVAIIATHSPVILQEVPKSCVWKLRRTGNQAGVERPERESFGENVSVLTNDIFGLEVTKSGYHQLLNKAIENSQSYEDVLAYFNNNLGSEGRSIARGLITIRNLGENNA